MHVNTIRWIQPSHKRRVCLPRRWIGRRLRPLLWSRRRLWQPLWPRRIPVLQAAAVSCMYGRRMKCGVDVNMIEHAYQHHDARMANPTPHIALLLVGLVIFCCIRRDLTVKTTLSTRDHGATSSYCVSRCISMLGHGSHACIMRFVHILVVTCSIVCKHPMVHTVCMSPPPPLPPPRPRRCPRGHDRGTPPPGTPPGPPAGGCVYVCVYVCAQVVVEGVEGHACGEVTGLKHNHLSCSIAMSLIAMSRMAPRQPQSSRRSSFPHSSHTLTMASAMARGK